MAQIPPTSATLLNDLARDSQHARWAEFVARYRPMMEAFLRRDFPSVDADEAVQERSGRRRPSSGSRSARSA